LLNQEINDRGFLIDQDLATAAIATCERAKAALQARTEDITGTDLSVQQRAALQALLREYGVSLPDMTASTLERRLEDPDLPAPVRELIGIRLEMCQTSNAKWPKLLASVSSDGRLRGTSQFCGASRTGRDSGRIFQPLNLPRPPKYLEGDEQFVDAIKLGVADLVYDNPMEVTSAALRGALVAPPGKKLVVADLNAIEGRVAAWVAGEQWKLDAYARGDDLYVLAYAASFHKPAADVTKAERQIGKVEELALGFGGAAGAFGTMAAMYGVELPDDEVRAVVKAWRAANPKIVQFWWDLERAVKNITSTVNGTVDLGPLRIQKQGAWLRIILPSGRSLSYAQPRIEDDQFTYMGLNQYTRKWERISSYGGKLFENVVQAIARDVLVAAMKRCAANGFDIVLTVYDEIIAEAVMGRTVDEMISLMTTVPHWAPGLPLAAGGFETQRYYKG
jgi:DNA polymerase I - 3'-5' exonuclease and polymerase domains